MTYLDLGKKLPNVVQTYMNFFSKNLLKIFDFFVELQDQRKNKP